MGHYVFSTTSAESELIRLRAIESYFDPMTQQCLTATGLGPGWQCLEVGAGAGSITQWLAQQVAPAGRVKAIDIDPRFLQEASDPLIEVRAEDIRTAKLEAEFFDLIHTRCVLIHLADWPLAVDNLLRSLKPGGWLLLEEPDFGVARALAGQEQFYQGFERVHQAIRKMFRESGRDPNFGVRLPKLLQDLGLGQIGIENDVPIVAGGSVLAEIMRLSALALSQAYLATGEASEADLASYQAFATDPTSWAIYHGLVRAWGRKPLV
jgi:SAM-dependent methyltransferase